MNVRRMPSAPPNKPASNTTLSRGDASPDWDASVMVQSSCANTNAAKSTSWESSTSRSRVDRPGLNVVVQGSTSATSSSPRVIAWSSLACLPDDPRKMRGLFMRIHDDGQGAHATPPAARDYSDCGPSLKEGGQFTSSLRVRLQMGVSLTVAPRPEFDTRPYDPVRPAAVVSSRSIGRSGFLR